MQKGNQRSLLVRSLGVFHLIRWPSIGDSSGLIVAKTGAIDGVGCSLDLSTTSSIHQESRGIRQA